jgi:hypothetical protein
MSHWIMGSKEIIICSRIYLEVLQKMTELMGQTSLLQVKNRTQDLQNM